MRGHLLFHKNISHYITDKTENPGQLPPEGRQTAGGKPVYSVYKKEDKTL